MSRRYLVVAATFEVARETRATAERLAAVDPGTPRTLVVVDGDPRTIALLAEVGEVLTGADLGISLDEVGRWAGAYGTDGVSWVAFPHVFAAIGAPGEQVLWISSAVDVIAPPAPFWSALDAADVVCGLAAPELGPHEHTRPDNANGTPYALQPVTSVAMHGGELIARTVLGWRAGSDAAATLWASWPVPRDHPTHEPVASGAVAQVWFNALALRDEVTVVQDPGVVLSIAQLLDREVTASGDPEAPFVDGVPLSILLLRNFDPERPHLLESRVLTARVSDRPALAPVLRARAQMLLDAGWVPESEGPPPPTRWAELPEGLPLTDVVRDLIRAGLRTGAITHSPYEAEGFAQLRAYATAPARSGGSLGVNRLLGAIWNSRPDLHAAYPALDGPDGLGFLGWAWVYGRAELGIPESFLPPRPAFLDAAPAAAEDPARVPDTPGVNLAGYFTSELGLGESARQIANALDSAGVPNTPVQGLLVPPTRQQAEFQPVGPQDAHHDVNVVVVNGDQMPHFARDVGPGFFEGRATVGVWWWEVDPFPAEEWAAAMEWVDEVWVGTEFIRRLVEPHVDVPVWVFPVPVSVQRLAEPLERSHFGFEDDETVFLYVWDYHSTEARKNPSGLVEAYKRAFPEGSRTRLVLKCINHQNLPEADEKVRLAAAGRDDITFIDRFLSGREKNGLLELCDCYVSPHRSEGFGYTPAEAMLLGKPVIVTAYGGTTQYTDESVARMIRWTETRVGPGALPYPPDGRWADPDLDDLADAMRWIVDEPEAAAAMAQRGRRRVEEGHAIGVSGAAMAGRLAVIRERVAREGVAAPAAAPAATQAGPGPRVSPQRSVLRRIARNVGGMKRLRASWWRMQDRSVAARTADLRQEVAELRAQVDAAQASAGTAAAAHASLQAAIEETQGTLVEQIQLRDRAREEQGEVFGAAVAAVRREVAGTTHALADHLERHAVEPWGVREAGFVLEPVEGLGRALGGSGLERSGDRYADFLAVFRGPYDRVLELMAGYEPLLRGQGPLLDIGSGRGELLEIAGRAGIEAEGVDLDAELVRQATERGHRARAGDGIAALADAADGSLGAVSAIHVVEHLAVEDLERLFREAQRALRPGGVLLVETINPHEVSAASTFWVDPTHRGPVFPEVALALALSSGFGSAHVHAPDGTGDWEADRRTSTRYALVARRGEGQGL